MAWHEVILTYNTRPDAADAVVRRIEQAGGKPVALKLDVANVASFKAFREAVVVSLETTWGASTLSGLVNNACYGLFNHRRDGDHGLVDSRDFNLPIEPIKSATQITDHLVNRGALNLWRYRVFTKLSPDKQGQLCAVSG